MTVIPFCGQTYQDKTLNASAQRAVNLYPARVPVTQYSDKALPYKAPEKIIMYPTPGYSNFFSSAYDVRYGDIRGGLFINTNLYLVAGSAVILIDTNTLAITSLGTLNTSTGRCSIVTNTVDITISDGKYGYVYNLTTGVFSYISTTGGWPLQGVTNLTYHDGYYLAAVNNSRSVIQSALLDGTTWPALAFDTLTSFPDNIVGVFSDQIVLYVFGPAITEPQSDAGSIPYAFQKVASVIIQAGCSAKNSIVKVGSTIMFLANDAAGSPYIAEMLGYNAKPVSTPPINAVIATYPKVNDAFSYTYREGESQFYVITFPSANNNLGATWAYDVKMQLWHERWSGMGSLASLAGSLAITPDTFGIGRDYPDYCFVYSSDQNLISNLHLVGGASPVGGHFYLFKMSQAFSTDIDVLTPLKRMRTCQYIEAEGKTLFIKELVIDVEPGVGLQDDQWIGTGLPASSKNPLATLEISRDGGHTFVTVGTAHMGVTGAYLTRLRFAKLGRVRRKAAFRLTFSDAVRTYILGAEADIKVGSK